MGSRKYEPGFASRIRQYKPQHDVPLPDNVELDYSNPEALAQSVQAYRVKIRESSDNETVDSLLDELARALSAKCTRSATILVWSAGVSYLADCLWQAVGETENGWNNLVHSARLKKPGISCGVDHPEKIPDCGQGFDINLWQKRYKEPQVVFLGFARGMYSADALEQLFRDCFRPRCRAAHPSSTVVPLEDVTRSLRFIAKYLFRMGA
ncbi:MAG: hypothetical protein GY906_22255 [bacterium]|nr:hypothetical protein [bacterium]